MPQEEPVAVVAATRFQPFFTAACISTRLAAQASQARIADLAGVKEVSIDRFERGETFPAANLETFAAAYAFVAKLDPRDLFLLAVDWWKRVGQPPLTAPQDHERLQPAPTVADVLEAIRRAELQGRGSSEERPSAIRRKRASGK